MVNHIEYTDRTLDGQVILSSDLTYQDLQRAAQILGGEVDSNLDKLLWGPSLIVPRFGVNLNFRNQNVVLASFSMGGVLISDWDNPFVKISPTGIEVEKRPSQERHSTFTRLIMTPDSITLSNANPAADPTGES